MELDLALGAVDRGLDQRDAGIAGEEPAQEAGEVGLGLDRDDARAEPAPGGGAVADMGADVEARPPSGTSGR